MAPRNTRSRLQQPRDGGRRRRRRILGSAIKKPITSYIAFCNSYRSYLRRKGRAIPMVPQFARTCSLKWRNMTSKMKTPFDRVAKSDSERYNIQKAAYNLNHPKRPISSYLRFYNQIRPTLREQNPGVPIVQLSRIAAQMWKNCPEEQKREFIQQARADMDQYKRLVTPAQRR